MIQCFQVRSIGKQSISISTVMMQDDVKTLADNYGQIFCLAKYKASQREDGTFDVTVTLEPGNGMAHVVQAEDQCTCHERDGSYICNHCYAKGLRGHMQKEVE